MIKRKERKMENQQTTQNVNNDSHYNESQKPSLISSTKLIFKDTFKMNKRMGRADFWWGELGLFLINIIVGIIINMILTPTIQDPTAATGFTNFVSIIYFIYLFFMFWMQTTALVRRLHDTGRSGAYFWLILIPLLGAIILIVMCCKPSESENNEWPTGNN